MTKDEIRIGIIVSLFNSGITNQLLQGALATLTKSGIDSNYIDIIKVPGAIEIPLIAKRLAAMNQYKAIICLGAVIQGETYHHDYVCQQVSQGCQQVMLEYNLPVIFGILATKNLKQAQERASGVKGHKGVEAANAAISMINLIKIMEG